MKKQEKNNGVFIVVLLLIITGIVFLFPKISDYLYKTSIPTIKSNEESKKEEKKEVTDEVIESIHFPKMRNSAYSEFTYYSKDTFKVSDMSNNDILYNAFLDLYEGNIVDSLYYSECSNVSKEFNPNYIELRVKNILGKNVEYELNDFTVPSDSNSNYTGLWHFNGNVFYYGGMCTLDENSTRYYDLEKLIEAKYDNDDIVLTYYVAFAKVIGDNYTIYSDALMTQEIANGTGDYNSAFNSLDTNKLKKYQYRFKKTLCSYDEYCLYEGKWLNV